MRLLIVRYYDRKGRQPVEAIEKQNEITCRCAAVMWGSVWPVAKARPMDEGRTWGVDMRHDFAGLEPAASWLHVVIAVVLLRYLIRGKDPAGDGRITLMQQIPRMELPSESLLPESTPQPSENAAARPPPRDVTVTKASFSASTTCRKEGP